MRLWLGLRGPLAPGPRLYLNPDGRGQPYVESGAEIGHSYLDTPELGAGFNSIIFGGLGLRAPLMEDQP